jgi:hypothetical protein
VSIPVLIALTRTVNAWSWYRTISGKDWSIFFLICIVRGGVQLGPPGTAATNKPIVPAPSDSDDGEIGGMMIGGRNRSTRRKPVPVPLRVSRTDTNSCHTNLI